MATVPVSGPITQGWGANPGYYQQFHLGTPGHEGIDYGVRTGTPVRAALAGVVTLARWYGNYGNYIEITHSGALKTGYAHLNNFLVGVGQPVSEGQVIALSNNTGNTSGPHLHFNLFINGRYVDPSQLQGGSLPYSDQQYNDLKADRDKFAEDWARLQYYVKFGTVPTRDERRLRLQFPFERATADFVQYQDKPVGGDPALQEKLNKVKEIVNG